MNDSVDISDPDRYPPILVDKLFDGSVVLDGQQFSLVLSADESHRLAATITGKPHIQRFPVATPAKARFAAKEN